MRAYPAACRECAQYLKFRWVHNVPRLPCSKPARREFEKRDAPTIVLSQAAGEFFCSISDLPVQQFPNNGKVHLIARPEEELHGKPDVPAVLVIRIGQGGSL